MPTDSQTELHDAITAYKAYLETGELCTRPLYKDSGDGSGYLRVGEVECVCISGQHAVGQLRPLRTRLRKAMEVAFADPSLRPALDALPGGYYRFNSMIDFTVNPPALAPSAGARVGESWPLCEYVLAHDLGALGRALSRLPVTLGEWQGGGGGILEKAMPVNIGHVAGDVNYATQGSNIAARSPSSGSLTQTTGGVPKPNPLTLVWQSVRKAWSVIAAVKGWWPAIKAHFGSGR